MQPAIPGEYTAAFGDYMPPWIVVVFFGIPLAMLLYVFVQDYRARRR
jgi:hypothetical protein